MRKVVLLLVLFAACLCQAQIRFQVYVSGLSQPVAMIQDPTMTNVQYVVQKGGIIRVIQNGALLGTNYVNLSGIINAAGEGGLLGLALPANYSTSGLAYVYYVDTAGTIRIARYTRDTVNPLTLNPATGMFLVTQVHPGQTNHYGGTLRFGPDGYLYAGFGDGGSGNDPPNNAQNPNTLLGKMIRIDVNGGDDFPGNPDQNYHVPNDNPFVDGVPISAMGAIWDFGVRNPWKWCFDPPALGGTGALIIADVGQGTWEEVDFEQPGTGGFNYGWRQREGAHNTGNGGTIAFMPQTDPIFEYNHNGGSRSITGGYVYRGSALGTYWQNRYFYVDEVNGQKWSFILNQAGTGSASDNIEHTSELGSIGNVVSIDIDSVGELYWLSFNGNIYKLISAALAATAWTVLTGNLTGGGLPDLTQADDARAVIGGDFTGSRTSPQVVVQLTTTAPAQTANTVRFFLEQQTNANGITQSIDMWDYVANVWVQVDSRLASNGVDQRVMVTPSTPNRFIQTGTRQMRAQIRFFTGNAQGTRWQARIDQAVWGFYP